MSNFPGYPNQPGYPAYPNGSTPMQMPGSQYPPQQSGIYPYPGQPPMQGYPGGPAPFPNYPPQPTGFPGQPGFPVQQAYNPQQPAYPGYAPQPGYPPAAGAPQQYFVPPNQQYPPQVMAQAVPQMAGATGYDEPTLRPFPAFNAESDAKVLNKAMKGLGTDEKAIIAVLANRSVSQRLQIATIYKTLFGKDLIKHLKSELSGKLEDCVVALLQAPEVYDAYSLHDAISGVGTKEEALIEIILSRSNAELQAVKSAYQSNFKKNLEKDVMDDTSGYFKRILVACLQCNRQEGFPVDHNQVVTDAKALHAAGAKKWGTDEAAFIGIFALRSFPHLCAVFDEYKRMANKDIEKSIKEEMSGDLENSFLALIRVARSKHAYFAERLYTSMKGAGTHDKRLIRIIVSRCEKDLGNIRKEFLKMYGKTVESFIADDCAGDYKKVLLALVNPGSR